MIRRFGDGAVAEVGVWRGEFSREILDLCCPEKLYLIDCWQTQDPEVYNDHKNIKQQEFDVVCEQVTKEFTRFPGVEVLRKFSHEAAPMFEDEYFDWVYIDGNHSYEAVREDLNLWWPKIKRGGHLSGHDYTDWIRIYTTVRTVGVRKAVDEFIISNGLSLDYVTQGILPSWGIKKP